jgi:hypothetical protein
MREDVTDQSLLEVPGLVVGESLGGTALTRVIKRILASGAEVPSNSFQANI